MLHSRLLQSTRDVVLYSIWKLACNSAIAISKKCLSVGYKGLHTIYICSHMPFLLFRLLKRKVNTHMVQQGIAIEVCKIFQGKFGFKGANVSAKLLLYLFGIFL